MIVDATQVVKHAGDCSIYSVNPANGKRCDICDCGELRRAVLEEKKDAPINEALWEAWAFHTGAVSDSMEDR